MRAPQAEVPCHAPRPTPTGLALRPRLRQPLWHQYRLRAHGVLCRRQRLGHRGLPGLSDAGARRLVAPVARRSLTVAREERGDHPAARHLHRSRRRLLSVLRRLHPGDGRGRGVLHLPDPDRARQPVRGRHAAHPGPARRRGACLARRVLVVGPAFGDLDWRGLALAFAASIATAAQFFAAARCRKTGVVAKVFWIHLLVLPDRLLIGFAPGSSPAVGPRAGAAGRRPDDRRLRRRLRAAIPGARADPGGRRRHRLLHRPVWRPLSSTLILGESLVPLQLLGGALVLAAIVANVFLEQRTPGNAAAWCRSRTSRRHDVTSR